MLLMQITGCSGRQSLACFLGSGCTKHPHQHCHCTCCARDALHPSVPPPKLPMLLCVGVRQLGVSDLADLLWTQGGAAHHGSPFTHLRQLPYDVISHVTGELELHLASALVGGCVTCWPFLHRRPAAGPLNVIIHASGGPVLCLASHDITAPPQVLHWLCATG